MQTKVTVQLANDVVSAAGFSPPILAALVFVVTTLKAPVEAEVVEVPPEVAA